MYIYVFDAGEFRKVGKTENPESRKKALLAEYGLEEFENEWVSVAHGSFNESECVAHSILYKSKISGEKFYSDFCECVKACMSAIKRTENKVISGEIDGLPVEIDPVSGFINATSFIKSSDSSVSLYQFLKNDSVSTMNNQVIESTGQPTHFTTRGKNAATFVHPMVFIELNRAASAKRKLGVYLWILNEMPSIDPVRRCLKHTFKNHKAMAKA